MRLSRSRAAVAPLVAVSMISVWCVAGGTSGAAGAGKAPIVIGYITSETGLASTTFADGAAGALARIKLQNAQGGVNGHKLVLVARDDQTSPGMNLTAAQELVQQSNAFGVIDLSAVAFGAAKFLNQQGVPVTGSALDGPEWGQQPNSNMFTFSAPVYTPFNGLYYTNTSLGTFLKSIGVTKLASLAYGISPSAVTAARAAVASAASAGIQDCYANYSVPFGAVDFTADVLVIKSKGCNGVQAPLVDSSDVALSAAVKQGGLNAQRLFYTGYSQDVLENPASIQSFANDYVEAGVNFVTPDAAVNTMLNAFQKYDPSYKAGAIPDLGLYGSYISADLMIKGLELAGSNPTRASFIANLRKVSSYNAGGILASPTTFRGFGTLAMVPVSGCNYVVQLKGTKFVVAYGGKPVCGHRISFTSPQ